MMAALFNIMEQIIAHQSTEVVPQAISDKRLMTTTGLTVVLYTYESWATQHKFEYTLQQEGK